MALDPFPFVVVPPELEKIIGKRDGPSHVWRQSGTEEECSAWYDALCECADRCVSPGGVSMYCPVSRAAVHRRVKDGKLSLFLFHVTETKSGLFRRDRRVRTSPYGFVPVSECKAWKKEFDDRAVRHEEITREDLEGAKPDWDGEFLEWDSRWRREQLEIGGERDVNLVVKLSSKEIDVLDKAAKSFGMAGADALATMILGDVTHGGMSGYSFMRLGMKISRMIEKSGKGVAAWKQLLKRS
ncbi:MAG TPA: hypothetical protein VK737_03340 [Opitutales bacterium]|jgi:hypothetical protein|nr:hypothetical protein [Opitutales bacterium]